MTLVIAEISRFGVVMAADTAETSEVFGPSGAKYLRIRFGAQKLFPIKLLNGGVSYWGAGEIYAAGPSGRIPTDIWLEDFIARERLQSLEQFAYTLRKYVNVLHGSESPPLGFHVAGIGKDRPGDKLPVFYRICNRDKRGGVKPEFDVERQDVFPRLDEAPEVFSDGDEALYADLLARVKTGEPLKSIRGDPIPNQSLSGRTEYQAAWVRFISDLYESAGLARTIGGKVTTLSIPIEGPSEIKMS